MGIRRIVVCGWKRAFCLLTACMSTAFAAPSCLGLTLTNVSPASFVAGAFGGTLKVSNPCGQSGDVVNWTNGSTTALATVFSAGLLTATVPAGLLATSGTAQISVFRSSVPCSSNPVVVFIAGPSAGGSHFGLGCKTSDPIASDDVFSSLRGGRIAIDSLRTVIKPAITPTPGTGSPKLDPLRAIEPPTGDPCQQAARNHGPSSYRLLTAGVNTRTGSLSVYQTAFVLPGFALPLRFTIFRNGLDPYNGPVGLGWTHNYNTLLFINSGSVTVKLPDGQEIPFSSGGAHLPGIAGVFPTLVQNGGGTFTMTAPNQIQYNYSSLGQLTSIADPNGNSQTMAYDGLGDLMSVTITAGHPARH